MNFDGHKQHNFIYSEKLNVHQSQDQIKRVSANLAFVNESQ